MSQASLVVKNIHKAFYSPVKTSVLRGIDLAVYPGETVAIMGRSGEGKSTLLNILGTLEKPCQGVVEIAGKDSSCFNHASLRNRHIGFVFQSFHLLEDYTVLDNVLMPARIARHAIYETSEPYKQAVSLLELVGLKNRATYNAKQLSGGEKQRATIARALCNNPDIVLADEPSGNLDRTNADNIHRLLIDFVKTTNKSLVVVTHDEQLASLCDTKYHLIDGKLMTYPLT